MKNHTIMINQNRNKNIRVINMKDLELVEDIMKIMIIPEIGDIIKEDPAVKAHKNHKITKEKDRNLQILINIKIISIIVDFNLKEDIPKHTNMIMKNLLKCKKVKKDLDQDNEINLIVAMAIEEDLNQLINPKNTIESISENQIYNLLWIKLSQKYFLFQEDLEQERVHKVQKWQRSIILFTYLQGTCQGRRDLKKHKMLN